jgi:SP family arabinose:H+ symporter-like MFS transporter
MILRSEEATVLAEKAGGGSTKQAGKAYVFLVAFVAALGGFLFGVDLNIIGSAMVFLKDQFQLNPSEIGFAAGSALLGCVFGPILGILLGDRIGRKRCLYIAALLFAISAVGTALPKTILQFNTFRFIGGLGVGFSSVVAPMFIAEIAPAAKRGRLVLMYQLAITLGAMLGVVTAWILAATLAEDISWRWMFGLELVPCVIFCFLLFFVPRSPRWLAQKGHTDEALHVLTKINGPARAAEELSTIKASISAESGTFGELFQPGFRLALLVGVILAFLNNWTGWSCVAYYQQLILQQAGFTSPAEAIGASVFSMVANVVLTLLAISLVDRWGRRPMWIFGSLAMIVSTLLMGLIIQANLHPMLAVVGVVLVLIPHAVALGPLPWLMISELFPTRIRARAVSIATVCVWVAGYTGTQLFPMIGSAFEKQGVPGGTYWVFTVICVFSLVFGLKLLPETKGRTLEEIAESWKRP